MITTVLFDFDGVIADTEPQYDEYVEMLAQRYQLGIPDFALKVKGTTTSNMLQQYFGHLPHSEHQRIKKELDDFEGQMSFPPVAGALGFLNYLRCSNYKIGLVTSSPEVKMQRALREMEIEQHFDTQVTANRITHGKPHPMCYLLAAQDLDTQPQDCLVFEDSFNGIASGLAAGMHVVGVSTTIEPSQLLQQVEHVIPDFEDLPQLLRLLK